MHIKHLLITGSFLLTGLFAMLQTASQASPPESNSDRGFILNVRDQAPADFELQLTDGTKTCLQQLCGKVVILQFTVSWCSICLQEMPHLEKEEWQTYSNKGLLLIGVDRDESLAKVQKFHRGMNISYPLAFDPGADIFGRFANKKSGVTRNVVIDKTAH